MKDMQPRIVAILVCLLITFSGCVAPEDTTESTEIPLQLAFSANTLDRAEDGGSEFVLKESLETNPVLVLWIAAGCSLFLAGDNFRRPLCWPAPPNTNTSRSPLNAPHL